MSLLPSNLPGYGDDKGAYFNDVVLGADGCVYGIPFSKHFVKFDPKDDSITKIGPDLVNDLGFGEHHSRYGVLANDGCIYVINHGSQFMLKVDTNEGEHNGVVEVFEVEFPAEYDGLPRPRCSGALGPDGYLYFPFSKHKLIRFDPKSRQVTVPFPFKSPVILGGRMNIADGRLFILPQQPGEFDSDEEEEMIVRVDLQTSSTNAIKMGNAPSVYNFEASFKSHEGGIFDRDGSLCFLNHLRQVGRLDPRSGRCFFRDAPGHFKDFIGSYGEFGSPCLGGDGCIYWPPIDQDRMLKYDPYCNVVRFVGTSTPSKCRWKGGVTAPNGKTYFFPFIGNAKQILVVDPLAEFQADIFNRVGNDPLNFGSIFQIEDHWSCNTAFDVGDKKFGMDVMLEIIDESIHKNQAIFDRSKVPVSLLAGLCEECPLDVIYHLTRKQIGEMKYHFESAIATSIGALKMGEPLSESTIKSDD